MQNSFSKPPGLQVPGGGDTPPIDKPPPGVLKPRFVALDSLRGICALAVTLFHFPVAGAVAASPFVRHSFMFVDFFFVLSGFVIATVYEKSLSGMSDRRAFAIRRFGRLWPLHVTMLAVFIFFRVLKGGVGVDERHSVAAIFTNIAMIHGLGIHKDLTWNGPSWSISVEAFLYLAFVALSLIPWRPVIYAVLVVGALFVLRNYAPAGMFSTFDFGIYRGLAGFFTGALLARAPLRPPGTLVEVLTVLVVLAFVYLDRLTILTPFVFGAAVYVFAGSHGLVGRALHLKPIVKLGEWSYSIYMVHAAVAAAFWAEAPKLGFVAGDVNLIAPNALARTLSLILYLAAVVGISAFTYRFVESPARDAFNRLAKRQKRAAAPA